MAQSGLGLSLSDRKLLLAEIDVIFHCAALIRFDLPLLSILKVNVQGTQQLLELATLMNRLVAFVFISTAFSQSYQTTLEEKHYPTGLDLTSLLKSIQTNDSETIAAVQNM
jgi:alcohol-forming fatty acyl-CoA reductase